MALHTEGEARARFAAAISAEHFAAVAQARLRGEATSADGSAADDELLGRAYRLLARDEHNMWRLLERHLRFAGGGAEAWMCEVLAWLEGMADTPDAAPSRCAWDRTAGMPGRGGALDPDAAARHECTVHPDDREAEDRFLRALWGYIRAGQLERAQKHCRSSQQWWRAASLSPAAEHGERGLSRSAWRAACRELARDAGAPAFERAIYAVLSADGDTLQAFRSASEDGIQGVLSSWYDKLFVWVKVCVDAREDLVAQGGEAKPSCDATQESLALFLQSCSVATAEDVLAGAVADSVGSENAAVAETWINGAIHFYRGVQELLIFGGHRELPLSRIWGVLPTGLRWPSRLSADRARLPTDIQQLGDDLSSQVTRSALHAGVLLSQSGPEGTTEVSALAAGELEALCREYVQLLAASLEDEASESLSLVAGYTNWLPQRSQGDTLVEVLKGMPALAWQEVLANAAVQPAVVADVQYRVVQSILCGPSTDDDKLVALRWACSHIVDDGHDGLFMRMQGLRQVNSFLRARLLDEGMDGLSSEPPCALLDAGKVLCGAEMSDLFERICEAVSRSSSRVNQTATSRVLSAASSRARRRSTTVGCEPARLQSRTCRCVGCPTHDFAVPSVADSLWTAGAGRRVVRQ